MAWNMPDGATTDQYDRYCGTDQPDDPEDDYAPEELADEDELLDAAELLERFTLEEKLVASIAVVQYRKQKNAALRPGERE
jgi:hypothetical protein